MTPDFLAGWIWQAGYWHWWVLGMVMLGVEVFAPGFIFIWLGAAAGIVGGLLYLDPGLRWQYQVLIFALTSLASILVSRAWLRPEATTTDQPALNRRAAHYLGRRFTLEEPIVNSRGRIHVDDSWWRVEGQDLPVGHLVQVVAVDGVVLRVEPAS